MASYSRITRALLNTTCASATLKRPSRVRNEDRLLQYFLQQRPPQLFARHMFSSNTSAAAIDDHDNNPEENLSRRKVIRSVYDASDRWEDWFAPEEYGSPWEYTGPTSTMAQDGNGEPSIDNNASINKGEQHARFSSHQRHPMILESLSDDPALDSSSRHLIHQLQLLYHNGFTPGEFITTQRCQDMLRRLLTYSSNSGDKNQNIHAAVHQRQRVIRAEALLRTMELFWDFVPDLIEDAHAQRRNIRAAPDGSGSHGRAKPAVKWPLPTYDLYVHILQTLGSLRAPKQYQKNVLYGDIPWICHQVVVRLYRYHQIKGFVFVKKPPVEAWNQVLSAWANVHGDRDHPEKSLHATQFFMDMKLEYHVQPDTSSYAHVLRACAHDDGNALAQELGGRVAVKFWNGHMKDELQLQSFAPSPHLFVFFMRAVANLSSSSEVDQYLREAFDEACRAGVINEHVLYELEQSSDPLFKELMKPFREKVDPRERQRRNEAYDKSYHLLLLDVVPDDWKRNIGSNSNK